MAGPENAWKYASSRRASSSTAACAHLTGSDSASRLGTPTTGIPSASPSPRAADSPIRRPVNDPGPVVTAMRLRSL